MSFHAATIGELLIVEAFVLVIWFKVLIWTLRNEPPNPQFLKVMTTSSGLIISSLAVFCLMLIRAYELYNQVLFTHLAIVCYAVLAFGNFLFIISASIGNSWKQVRLVLLATLTWTSVFILSNIL